MKVNTARHVLRTVGALLLGLAVAGAPGLTYAQHNMGGGGGHFSGGGGGHMGGGGAHFGGGGGARFGGGHYGGAHFGGPGHFSGMIGGGAHFAGSPHFSGPHVAVHGAAHFTRPGFAPGGWHGGGAWGGWHGWNGGYWHGRFWPHVWFGPGFSWFLPVLPLGYATFWWGGMPYYYWNNLYYTWSPTDNGYVVTDPPPAAGSDAADSGADDGAVYSEPSDGSAAAAAAPSGVAPGAPGSAASDVYLYPRNGQSSEQTQNDRYECHSWAVNQTGFDPTRAAQQSGNTADYRRAMIACLDARGYSAR
jgi:hypothetical protein